MRSYKFILLLGAAIGLSPPAQAQSILTGCYRVTDEVGSRFCTEIRAVSQTASQGFTVLFRGGSWTLGDLSLSNTGAWQLSGSMSQVSGGQSIGGTYHAPTSATAAGEFNANFNTGLVSWDGNANLHPFERENFVPNGSITGPVSFGTSTGWYVGQQMEPTLEVRLREEGIGRFVEFQGDTLRIMYAAYDDEGNPRTYSVQGACVFTPHHCLLSAPLMDGLGNIVTTMIVRTRHGNALEEIVPSRPLPTLEERWLVRHAPY